MTISINPNGYTFHDGSIARHAPDKIKSIVSACTYDAWAVQTFTDEIIVAKGNTNGIPAEAGTGFQSYHSHTKLNFGIDTLNGSKIKTAKIHAGAGVVLFENGNLWLWGHNGAGAAATGNTTAAQVPWLALTGVRRVWTQKNFGIDANTAAVIVEKTDFSIWGTGHNASGRLGLGDTTNRTTFTQITGLGTGNVREIWMIGALYGWTVVQFYDNRIFVAGYNGHGQLGTSDTTNRTSFTDVTTAWGGAEQITDITGAGGYYDASASSSSFMAMVVKSTKTVYTAGYNAWGSIGNSVAPSATNYSTPVNTGVSNVVQIASYGGGVGTVHALKADGTYWSWGYNGYSQLGNGTTTNSSVPTQRLTGVAEIMLKEYDSNTYPYVNISMVKKTDGTVWVCGYNSAPGYCGIGNTIGTLTSFVENKYLKNVKQVAMGGFGNAGHFFTAIDENDEMLQWGYSRRTLDNINDTIYYTAPLKRFTLRT